MFSFDVKRMKRFNQCVGKGATACYNYEAVLSSIMCKQKLACAEIRRYISFVDLHSFYRKLFFITIILNLDISSRNVYWTSLAEKVKRRLGVLLATLSEMGA